MVGLLSMVSVWHRIPRHREVRGWEAISEAPRMEIASLRSQ
jgi:hypothetical protein